MSTRTGGTEHGGSRHDGRDAAPGHAEPANPEPGRADIIGLPAFDDNYVWAIAPAGTGTAIVVDPGDAAPVQRWLHDTGRTLTAIVLTHHHGDHTGGVRALKQAWPDAVVCGPADGPFTAIDRGVRDGDVLSVDGLRGQARVLAVPGHTLDHVAWYFETLDGRGPPVLFCGDTLFAAGCGRLFEGTPGQMAASLARLAALPGDTLVYCAHEYTLSNLAFARAVEPDSDALRRRIGRDLARRAAGRPTVPTTIALERDTNPFLRTGHAGILAHVPASVGADVTAGAAGAALARHDAPVRAFAALRRWKDTFRGSL